MNPFVNAGQQGSLSVKLWRGERMCLIGMDVPQPEDDFVGFAIESRSPTAGGYSPLRNRLAFAYVPGAAGVDGYRNFDSREAPFQKFRWIHFPHDPKDGKYSYRVTKMHMKADGKLVAGDQVKDLDISLDQATYGNYLDVGFTRNFASSQAYNEKYNGNTQVIPTAHQSSLDFQKLPGDIYQWLGFEAYDLIFGILDEVVNNPALSLDVLAYDANESDIVKKLQACGSRLRIVIDDSGTHGKADSEESQAAERLAASAGAGNVKRMHFKNLQHHKVLIVRKDGKPVKVLFGSTNFSFRGLYIQANNALVFYSEPAAALFARVFELAFAGGDNFTQEPVSGKWHLLHQDGMPPVHLCFSPHADPGLSLNPVGAAIDQATSSVFYSIAFLNQICSGPTRDAVNRLTGRPVFSYGISDKNGDWEVTKPDGSAGQVDFAYLSAHAPEPFKSEWAGGSGVHQHDKFVVTDFSLPTAKVFTGSSNLSPSGEANNGDNLVLIEDPKVATSYAIEALRIFDHLHFRSNMQKAGKVMTLDKPTALSGQPAWFEKRGYYVAGSQAARDRLLFSR
jgi:hypothetical protein